MRSSEQASKRPTTAYALWKKDVRQRLQDAGLPTNNNALNGGEKWRDLNAEKRQPYLDEADKQMLEYLSEKFVDSSPIEYNLLFNALVAVLLYLFIMGVLCATGFISWLQACASRRCFTSFL